MRIITATEFARNFKATLDKVEFKHEEIVIMRNNQKVARVIPGPVAMTALEALADLYRTLPEEAGAGWLEDARSSSGERADEVRDPWAS